MGLNHTARKIYKKKIKNFIITYIKSDIKKIILLGKKKTYKKKKNILGIDIKPEEPIKPHFIIENDFKNSLKKLSYNLFKDINKKIRIAK